MPLGALCHLFTACLTGPALAAGSDVDAEQARQAQTLSPSQGASRHPSRFSSKGSQLGGALLEQHDSQAWREELEAMQSRGSSSSDDLPPTAAAHGDTGRCAFPGCHRCPCCHTWVPLTDTLLLDLTILAAVHFSF